MLKHNKGKISLVLVFINILLILYFINNYQYSKPTTVALNISKDVTVSENTINDFQSIINSHNYNTDALNILKQYEWYFTNTEILNNYMINGQKITINVNANNFTDTINEVLNKIIT